MKVEDMSGEELANAVTTAQPVTMGIGQLAKHLILNTELSNEEILKRVKQMFPDANTGMASIAWYRSDLRKKGLLGPKSSRTTVTLSPEQLEALTK